MPEPAGELPGQARHAAEDWAAFRPEEIPTKGAKLPAPFGAALERVEEESGRRAPEGVRTLELGCGVGELAAVLHGRGHRVVGVDVNAGAVAAASERCPGGRFLATDVVCHSLLGAVGAALGESEEPEGFFDFAVLQLLLSIVGGIRERSMVLRNALRLLRPAGTLYLSCSGTSADINPSYARLYEQDRAAAGEDNTYFSRDTAGRILYATHHFTREELEELLERIGFCDVSVEVLQEASSRRPQEAARFLYAAARRPAEAEGEAAEAPHKKPKVQGGSREDP